MCEQALTAAGLPVTVIQPVAMQTAAGLLAAINSQDPEAVLTADMCEQAIIRVKAYMAEEAARQRILDAIAARKRVWDKVRGVHIESRVPCVCDLWVAYFVRKYRAMHVL